MKAAHAAGRLRPAAGLLQLAASAVILVYTALAAVPFTHVFAASALLWPLTLALLLPAAAALAPVRSAFTTGMLGVAAVVAAIGLSAPSQAFDALRGSVSGWARVLDSSLLAPGDVQHLPIAVLAVAVASAGGVLLTVRTRSPMVPLLPGLLLFVVGRAFGTRGGTPTLLGDTFALVFVTAVYLYIRYEPVWRPARAAGAAAAVGVAGVVGLVVAPALPAAAPFDPSHLRHHQVAVIAGTDPLTEVRAAQSAPDVPMLRVAVSAPAPVAKVPVFLRVAVLDRFDGTHWLMSGHFRDIGPTIPTDPGRAGTAETTTLTLLQASADAWVPTPINADRVEDTSRALAYDVDTQTLAAPSPLRAGDVVRVASSLQHPTQDQLLTAAPLATPAGVALPAQLPSSLRTLAQQAAGQGPTFIKASNLLHLFRTRFGYDPQAAAGDTLHDLAAFLDVGGQGRLGGSDQFAAAFTLLARAAGIPARVAVGYATTAGVHVLHSRQLIAWPEVGLAGIGWVPLTPESQDRETNSTQAPPPESAASATAVRVAGGTVSPQPVPPLQSRRRAARDGSVLDLLVICLAAFLVVASPVAIVTLAAVRRRRRDARRRSGDGRRQVAAAWRTAREALVRGGFGAARCATPAEVEREAIAHGLPIEGARALSELRALLESALFCPAGRLSDGDADAAWLAASEVDLAVSRRLSLGQRVGAFVDPREPAWAVDTAPAASGR